MLLKYSVSNFMSIGHNIEFSMFPLGDSIDERFLTEIDTVAGKWKVLKRGVFFGPNASGKTSFVKSLEYAKRYILREGAKNLPTTDVNQFKFRLPEYNGITTFQFVMCIDRKIYSYGFSLDNSYIHEEWLSIMGKDRTFIPLFDRFTNKRRKTSIKVNENHLCKSPKENNLIAILKESFEEKQARNLFLYRLSEEYSFTIADEVYSWFKNITIIYPDSMIKDLPVVLRYQTNLKNFISESLQTLDTGIDSIKVSTKRTNLADFVEKYNIPDELRNQILEAQNGAININGKLFIFGEEKNVIKLIELKFMHKLYDKYFPFNVDEESDGTKRLIDILPVLFTLEKRQKDDSIFIIDELDRSLHTKLSKYFVEAFVRSATNTQLLFTTHDVNLLNLKNFRQDEIWFIEKNKNGETRLKPFSDFDFKNKENILKDYLTGRFGAVPVIKEGV